jgi:hypothetical protein
LAKKKWTKINVQKKNSKKLSQKDFEENSFICSEEKMAKKSENSDFTFIM